MTQCSRCGRNIGVESSIKGRCEVCGSPLCLFCVSIDHATHCGDHAPDAAPAPVEPSVCAICGKWPVDIYGGIRCTRKGCEALLCNECVAGGSRCCPEHAAQLSAAGGPEPRHAQEALCAFCGQRIGARETAVPCQTPGCRNMLCEACREMGETHCGLHLRRLGRGRTRAEKETIEPPAQVILHPASTGRPPEVERPAEEADPLPPWAPPSLGERRRQHSGEEALGEAVADLTPSPADSDDAPNEVPLPDPWSEKAREAIEMLPDAPAADADTVGASQARAAGLNFMTRFRRAMAEPRTVTIGFSDRTARLPGWNEPTRVCIGDSEVQALSRLIREPACAPNTCPANASEQYELTPRPWLCLGRGKRSLLVEARSFVRPARYLKLGCDWEPVAAEELLPALEDYSRQADLDGYFHVLCLYSPTGWDADAVALIAGEPATRRLILPGVKVVLAGAQVDQFVLNPDDPRAAEIDEMLPLALAQERLGVLGDAIRRLAAGRSGVTLGETTSELDCDEAAAIAAFKLLAGKGEYEIICPAGGEPMLARRDSI